MQRYILFVVLGLLLWLPADAAGQVPTPSLPNIIGTGLTYDVVYAPDGTVAVINTTVDAFVQDTANLAEPPTPLNAHTDTIWDIVFTPDGSQFLTLSADGSVVLWETATLTRIHTLEISEVVLMDGYQPFSAEISPDGRFAAIELAQATPSLYVLLDLQSLEYIGFPDSAPFLLDVVFVDGRLRGLELRQNQAGLVVNDYTINGWEPTFTTSPYIAGENQWLTSDGRFIIKNDSDVRQVFVYNANERTQPDVYPSLLSPTFRNSDIVPYLQGDNLMVWTADGIESYAIPTRDGAVTGIEVLANDRLVRLAYDNLRSNYTVIDRRTGALIEQYIGGPDLEAFSTNGDAYAFFIGTNNADLQLIIAGTETTTPPTPNATVERLTISPDGTRLVLTLAPAAEAVTQQFALIDLSTPARQQPVLFTQPATLGPGSFAFHPNGTTILHVTRGGIFDLESGQRVQLPGLRATPVDIAYATNDAIIVADEVHNLARYNTQTSAETWLVNEGEPIQRVRANENIVAVLLARGEIVVRNATDGSLIVRHAGTDADIDILPDTNNILGLSTDGLEIRLYTDLGLGEAYNRIAVPLIQPVRIEAGPNGEVAVAGLDPDRAGGMRAGQPRVIVFDGPNDTEPVIIDLEGQFVTDMDFSSNGDRLAIANVSLGVYDTATGDLVAMQSDALLTTGVVLNAGSVYYARAGYTLTTPLYVGDTSSSTITATTTLHQQYTINFGGGGGGFLPRQALALSPDGTRISNAGNGFVFEYQVD